MPLDTIAIRLTSSTPATGRSTPAVVSSWTATGNPAHDLASWTRSWTGDAHAIASRSIACNDVEGSALSALTRDAFVEVLSQLPAGPCRIWAFLPRPNDISVDRGNGCEIDQVDLDRYMRFNAGRTMAYRALNDRVRVIPAGTCVGHYGTDLVVHALWLDTPLHPVENPRQRPAWQYSSRYGPTPPAFTRAMRTSSLLLASGTASVVGEDSVHHDALVLQFEESLRNLQALATAATATTPWRSLQIYVRDADDLEAVRALAFEHFGTNTERILHAPICRRELRVEIEGVCDVC